MRIPRTLWGYVAREYARSLALALVLFTATLCLFFFARFSRDLARYGLTGGDVLAVMPSLLPYVLAYALPLSALAAAVAAFGSLAENGELTAAAAAGVSRLRLAAPVLGIGLVLCAANLWLYDGGTEIAFALARGALASADRRTLERDLVPGRSVLVPGAGGEGGNARVEYRLHLLPPDARGRKPILVAVFRGGLREQTIAAEDCRIELSGPGSPAAGGGEALRLTLREAELVSREGEAVRFAALPLALALDRSLMREISLGRTNSTMSLSENLRERDRLAASGDLRAGRAAAAEVHRKRSMALASLAFILFGIPLGATARRGSRALGFALAVLVACLAYLPAIVAVKALAGAGSLPPAAMWAPTVLLAAAGAIWLLRGEFRGARGGSKPAGPPEARR